MYSRRNIYRDVSHVLSRPTILIPPPRRPHKPFAVSSRRKPLAVCPVCTRFWPRARRPMKAIRCLQQQNCFTKRNFDAEEADGCSGRRSIVEQRSGHLLSCPHTPAYAKMMKVYRNEISRMLCADETALPTTQAGGTCVLHSFRCSAAWQRAL